MDDESDDERCFTSSNGMDDLSSIRSGFSLDDDVRSSFSLDIGDDTGSYRGDGGLKIDLGQLDDEILNTGKTKSVRLELPHDNDTNSIPDADQTFRSKSSLRTTPKSVASQYLSTGTARSKTDLSGSEIDPNGARSETNSNNNNNFTFDQFLQALDDPGTKSDNDYGGSLGYDQKSDLFNDDDDGKSISLASKSGVFSEPLSKSEDRTFKSDSGLNDVFDNSMGSKDDVKEYDIGPRTSANYINIPHGFQQKCGYEHNKKFTDLVDVTYNPRSRQFIFLDTRGITTWDKDGIHHTVNRALVFPKYQNKLLRNIIYCRKYNVYFCLAKDFSLKVLNKDFDETCQVASDLSSVMFLLFNPVRDELITGGVKGTKVWQYKQMVDRVWTEIKPMANYSLFIKRELKTVGGSWIRKVELDQTLQHLYCCSDTDVQCYDMDGKLVFKLKNAHKSQINGCKYSPTAKLLVTCANDCEVKVWSLTGGLVETFRSHSRSVTNLLLHPDDASLVLSSSLDGSVKVWSLDVMELMYSIVISTEGIQWMGLTGEKCLWTATCRDASVWQLNQSVRFFALARCRTSFLQVSHAQGKTSRVVAIGEDSSVRVVSIKEQRNLSTVLPPPNISPLQQVQSVTYNRECSLVFILVDPSEVWVYTMRTDPACRVAVWDVKRMQERWHRGLSASSTRTRSPSPTSRPSSSRGVGPQVGLPNQRATLPLKSNLPCNCSTLASINTHILYWTDEGFVSPLKDNFLLFGLEDGRILFLDPVKQGHRYCELQATRDAILDMSFDSAHSNLIVKSRLREEDLFQFWSIPNLELKHEVLVTQDVTSYARLGLSFFTGHKDGTIIMFTLEQVDLSKNRFQHGSYMVESSASTSIRRKEHLAAIVGVDSCPILGIVATCSCDGSVKIWDEQKTLMTEITVDDSLSSACFLTNQGDLLIGYRNHLFVIDHIKILPSITKQQPVDEILEAESEIYEDPAVRYEGAAANPEPISVDNYLVPFDLDFNERFLGGQHTPTASEHSSEKEDGEGSESEFSMAHTEVYGSRVSTPRLSVVDFLISEGEPIKGEIKEKTAALALRKRKKYRTTKWTEDQHGIEFDMPKFGLSPGPSPTCTPPSTPSEVTESEGDDDDIDDEGDMKQWEEEEDIEEDEQQPSEPVQEQPLTIVQAKPAEVKPKVADYQLPEHLREERSARKLKVDVKALMSRGLDMKTKITVKPSKVVKQGQPDTEKETLVQKEASGSAKPKPKSAVVKKKGLKGPRARVGDKAAAAYKAKAEKEIAISPVASKEKISDSKVTKPVSKTKSKTETAIEPTTKESPPPKPETKLNTTKLDIQPLPKLPEVRTGVKPGPVLKANPQQTAKKGGKRMSIFGGYTKKMSAEDEEEAEEEGEVEPVVEEQEGGEDQEGVGDVPAEEKETVTPVSAPGTPFDTATIEDTNASKDDASVAETVGKFDTDGDIGDTLPGVDGVSGGEDGEEMMDEEFDEDEMDIEFKEQSRPGSAFSIMRDAASRGAATSIYSLAERAVIISKYGSQSPYSTPNKLDSTTDEFDNQDIDSRIASSISRHSLVEMLEDSPTRSSRMGMRAPSVMSTSSIGSRTRTPYGGDLEEFYPLEEVEHDNEEGPNFEAGPNFEVMLRRNGKIEHIGSATSRTDSPFMRSVSQATARVSSSRAGERSVYGSILGDVEAELGRQSVLEDEVMTSEVGLPVSPEWLGRLARPNTAQGRNRGIRPHTAGGEMHVTFQDEQDDDDLIGQGIPKFNSFPVTSDEISKCYKNDGLQFEENWQDRLLERNRLLKLQKQQRAQSAANKRHLLELRQRQRRKAMVGHHQCTDDLLYMSDNSAAFVPPVLPESPVPTRVQRVKSAPAGRIQFERNPPKTRQAFTGTYKEQNSADRPYRLRMNPQDTKPRPKSSDIFDTTSTSRPRLVRRAQSGKSIPSKTRRFVLVTQHRPEPSHPVPSPLERQLLKARFPKTKRHLLEDPEPLIPRRHSTPNVSRVASVADFVM